jgi:N-ethylmaleimide reductase
MTTTQPLLTPVQLGAYQLPNRIIMAPLTRTRAQNEHQAPTELQAQYYAQRASAGLIISEGSPISKQGQGYLGTPGIYLAEQIAGWQQVTEAVHAKGGRIFIQLWHCGRISHAFFQNGQAPVAPSAISVNADVFTNQGFEKATPPRALELHEIKAIVQDFKQAAENAKAAGFDGVELHGANGYLIDQFLQDSSNQRHDEYGGTIANRSRFLLEVLEAVISVWGHDKVGVRLSPSGLFNFDAVDSNSAATFGYVIEQLNAYHLAFLELLEPLLPIEDRPNMVKLVTQHFRPIYQGTLITNVGYTQATGNQVIQAGMADLVSFGRSFIANPDLPQRFALNAPLNTPDERTFYGSGPQGYTDYPSLSV